MALTLDDHGHLANAVDWSKAVACAFAEDAGIKLEADHWRVIAAVRAFHQETGVTPSMRPLVKLVRERAGEGLGSSIALMRLFPPGAARGGSARVIARIAGLPVPENCL